MKKFIRSTVGASAVEFALLLPLLLVLLFGSIEFGFLMFNQAVITNASREGARFAATFYTNPDNESAIRPTREEIIQYVEGYVRNNQITVNLKNPNARFTVECLTTTQCNNQPYCDYTSNQYIGYVDIIRIRYNYSFLVLHTFVKMLTSSSEMPSWASLTLTATSAMRDENQTN